MQTQGVLWLYSSRDYTSNSMCLGLYKHTHVGLEGMRIHRTYGKGETKQTESGPEINIPGITYHQAPREKHRNRQSKEVTRKTCADHPKFGVRQHVTCDHGYAIYTALKDYPVVVNEYKMEVTRFPFEAAYL